MPIIKEDPLHKYDPLDFKQLKGEVTEAMGFDWKRDKVDDAKKRAIYDSRNYDEFKARVAGCTLKSIHRNEFNEPPKYAFNRQSGGRSGGKEDGGTVSAEVLQAVRQVTSSSDGQSNTRHVPKTGRDFERALRRQQTAAGKVALLEQLDEESCVALFGRELDAEVLRQILVAMEKVAEQEGSAAVSGTARRFLNRLSSSCPASFSMAMSFLTPSEIGIVSKFLAMEDGSEVAPVSPSAEPSEEVQPAESREAMEEQERGAAPESGATAPSVEEVAPPDSGATAPSTEQGSPPDSGERPHQLESLD